MPKSKHTCSQCDETFASKYNLQRHMELKHKPASDQQIKHTCQQCDETFATKYNLQRHMKLKHKADAAPGELDHQLMDTHDDTPGELDHQLMDKCDDAPEELDTEDECDFDESAIDGAVLTKTISITGNNRYDFLPCLASIKDRMKKYLERTLRRKNGIKWHAVIKVQFARTMGDEIQHTTTYFNGKCHAILKKEDIEDTLAASFMKMNNSFIEFQRNGSSWTLDMIEEMTMKIAEYRPLRGSTYIPTPPQLHKKMAIINPQNSDNKCFAYSILAGLYPAKHHPHRITNYTGHMDSLNFDKISFPIKLTDITKFEKKNNISVNVFGFEKSEIYPLHITTERFARHVNLLLLCNGEKQHYVLIKSLNRLLGDQNRHNGTTYFCHYCLHGFISEKLLENHIPYCEPNGPQKIEMPEDGENMLYFKDVAKQLRAPYVVYADFESIVKKVSGCSPPDDQSYTVKNAIHEASGFTYKIVSSNPKENFEHVTYRGPNAADVFVDHMIKVEKEILGRLENIAPMEITEEQQQSFNAASQCHICSKPLNGISCRDHDHTSGEYRGPSHNKCNLNYKFKNKINVIFHNLSGYDSHILMQAIGKHKNRRVHCIPQNMEKYIMFSLGSLQFIDSFQFLATSLEKLCENLAKEGAEKFPNLRQFLKSKYPNINPECISLLLRKGVYPYDYLDDEDKFQETRLPPKECFFNTLNEEHISQEDYDHALNVWHAFGICSIGQYHDLYMETDVHLLCDIFENFRNVCLNHYKLDPCHFFTSPGLAWAACLKMTDVKLELLTDIDMLLFLEGGLRGGVSFVNQRYAEANNKYLANYNESEPSNYLVYLDANNLYGWAMSQCLPTHGFQWLNQGEVDSLDVLSVADDASEGYILEVDLEYPSHLHDMHNDYPLAPERMKITDSMLSPYAKSVLEDLNLPWSSTEKLVTSLGNKENYVIHYRNLKLYLELGMKLNKIHRGLKFNQSAWLKDYIDFNTEKRKLADNDFEKDFFKLMNNSVFGKTMENLRKRVDVQLIHTKKILHKQVAKPNFKTFKIFNEDLVAVELKKIKLLMNRPTYIGFTVLELSKTLMYNFWYKTLKEKYGPGVSLCFTDTDSFCALVETDDIYKDMKDDSDQYDFSGYPKSHPCHDLTNKKVIGKFKDEMNSDVLESCVALKSKMYSLQNQSMQKHTAKGVKKYVVKNKLKHKNYKDCLLKKQLQRHKMTMIRSDHHQLQTITVNKASLSPFDDKRYIKEDGLTSLAYGHYAI